MDRYKNVFFFEKVEYTYAFEREKNYLDFFRNCVH